MRASASRQRTGELSTAAKSAARQRPLATGRVDGGDLDHVRVDLDAERAQERLAERPAGDARGGLAGGGALEDVAHVGLLVLLRADQVGVAGPRQVHLRDLGLDRPGAHPLLPVGVVAVGDLQRDRAAERAPVAHAGRDLGRVALDLHAPAAAVAELAARHVGVEVLRAQLQARRQTLDDAGQAGAVRLAGGYQAERHLRPSLFADGLSAVAAHAWRRGRSRGERRMAGEHEAAAPRRVAQLSQLRRPARQFARGLRLDTEGVAHTRGRRGARRLADARRASVRR